jgi:hypothetical protein
VEQKKKINIREKQKEKEEKRFAGSAINGSHTLSSPPTLSNKTQYGATLFL